MKGDGVARDEEAAYRYLSRLEPSPNLKRLPRLARMLRCAAGVAADAEASLRLYRRCAELDNVDGLERLALCYEKGFGVEAELIEAARLYERASHLGSRPARLSLGIFHWRVIGGFSMDRQEAVRLWRLGGLEIPESVMAGPDSISIPSTDSTARPSRLFSSSRETEETAMSRLSAEPFSMNEMWGSTCGRT
jgi:TPR repeat protein